MIQTVTFFRLSRSRSTGPFLTVLGGVVVIVGAIVAWILRGRLSPQIALLMPIGLTLVVNGTLRAARARAIAQGAPERRRVPVSGWFTTLHLVAVLAVLEVGINRIAVPMLRPAKGIPPAWHTVLDYVGLFLFYFTGVLTALVVITRARAVWNERSDVRSAVAAIAAMVTAVAAAAPLVIDAPAVHAIGLELAFAFALIATLAFAIGPRRDLGVQVGIALMIVPLLLHVVVAVGTRFLWPERTFDGPGVELARAGVVALCVAALASPYCFAPRPFARAVIRPLPLALSMAFAGAGAFIARAAYPEIARAATLALGVELSPTNADPQLALYLLSVTTLVWTLASIAAADSAARRELGLGLLLVLLGGYAFRWSHHFLLPLLGLLVIADAGRRVRDEELAAMPITSETPPIADATWASYVAAVVQALRRRVDQAHSLTTRGDGGLSSSLIIGDAGGLPLRARIERLDGSVMALDVVVGRELSETRPATLTLWAVPARGAGSNPAAPPATPPIRSTDDAFDDRFRIRGDATALERLFDVELRRRAETTLDGWLAYWDGEGLRYRVYPGHGAPLDHPIPVSELAVGRMATQPERLVAVLELLLDVAARGVAPRTVPGPSPEPTELVSP